MKLTIRAIFGMMMGAMLMVFAHQSVYAGPIGGLSKPDITKTLTSDLKKVIDDSGIKGNPITVGSDTVVGKNTSFKGKIDGLFDTTNTNYASVLTTTTQKIQRFINWTLGLLALICVIYLVYHGVILLVKFDDDKAQSEALGSIKTIARVIGGIGLSWFIVSVAFYIVSRLA